MKAGHRSEFAHVLSTCHKLYWFVFVIKMQHGQSTGWWSWHCGVTNYCVLICLFWKVKVRVKHPVMKTESARNAKSQAKRERSKRRIKSPSTERKGTLSTIHITQISSIVLFNTDVVAYPCWDTHVGTEPPPPTPSPPHPHASLFTFLTIIFVTQTV